MQFVSGVGKHLKHFYRTNGVFQCVSYDYNFRDKIHGIETTQVGNDWQICVYGGRYLAVCCLLIQNNQIQLISQCKLSDVISTVRINPENHDILDVVTTYNVALRMHLNAAKKLVIVQKSVCEERSTLYCSHLRYRSDRDGRWNNLSVFGGTALGEVLIWSPTENGKSLISYRFSTPRVSDVILILNHSFNSPTPYAIPGRSILDSLESRSLPTLHHIR